MEQKLNLNLIEKYRLHYVYWDPCDPNYKIRNKKADAWKESDISEQLALNKAEVMNKIETLIGQFLGWWSRAG